MWVTVLRAALLALVLTALCLSPSALAAELLACQAKMPSIFKRTAG